LLLRRNEGATGASRVTYGWDAIGRLTSQADVFSTAGSNVAWTFGHYNPASQITQETRDNDAYASLAPANGNTSYAVNGLNQYSSVAGTAYTYDANGNLTSDGVSTYGYDVENRLTTVTKGGVSVTLSYDPLGRLSKVAGSAISDRTFLYDGDAMVAEYSSGGAMQQRWLHGPNAAADDPLIQFDHSGNVSWLHADHLGSIVALTDASGGNPAINRYDEYGVPASTNVGRFQYTGQVWLSEIGLYYYKTRMYSPRDGRFLQTDPVGYTGGVNLYGYLADDPLNSVDPTGMASAGDSCGSRLPGAIAAGCFGIISRADGKQVKHDRSFQAPASARSAPVTVAEETGVVARLLGVLRAGVFGLFTLLSSDTPQTHQQVFVRYMVTAELAATRETGHLRGGRPGSAFFTSEPLLISSAKAANRYSLGTNPQVAVVFRFAGETPPYTTAITRPDELGHHGGGVEHTVPYPAPIDIIDVIRLRP
jgi:RHS repeat-associated protein